MGLERGSQGLDLKALGIMSLLSFTNSSAERAQADEGLPGGGE